MDLDNLALIAKHLGRIADCLEKFTGEPKFLKKDGFVPIFPPHTGRGKKRAILYYQYGWSIIQIWEFENPKKSWDKLTADEKNYHKRLIDDSLARYKDAYSK